MAVFHTETVEHLPSAVKFAPLCRKLEQNHCTESGPQPRWGLCGRLCFEGLAQHFGLCSYGHQVAAQGEALAAWSVATSVGAPSRCEPTDTLECVLEGGL